MPPKAKSPGPSTTQKRVHRDATQPGSVEPEAPAHVSKSASFYAEEHDLQEPELQEVEREIEEEIQSSRHHPSQELTLDLVVQHHALDDELVSPSLEDRAYFCQHLTHLRLDRMHLGGNLSPTVLSAMPRLTHVYLQHNQLSSMAGLAALPALRFAALSHNNIEKVEGIANLPCLMLLDLSYNQLHKLDVRQLPRSVGFLQIAGNPCTQSGSRSLRAELQAHLPRLRDLDGPLSEDDDSSGSDGAEQEGGSSSNEYDRREPEAEGDLPDDETPLPHLPQISDDGLPGSKQRGTEHRGEQENVEGAGGNGRLVRSALDMLEEFERACYASASQASRTSLRKSMRRAMRSVAEHPAMRPWRSTAGGLVAGKEGEGMGSSRCSDDLAAKLSRPNSDGGVAEGLTESRHNNNLASVLSRPSSGGGVAAGVAGSRHSDDLLAARSRSSSSSGGAVGVAGSRHSNDLASVRSRPSSAGGRAPGAVPTPLESSAVPFVGGRALRPVTPPASALAGLRSLSGRLEPLPSVGAPQGRPLPAQAPSQPTRPLQDCDAALQQRVEADLDLLRTRLRDLTEPLTAAALRRAPDTHTLGPRVTSHTQPGTSPASASMVASLPTPTVGSSEPAASVAAPSITATPTRTSSSTEPAESAPSSSHSSIRVPAAAACNDTSEPPAGAATKLDRGPRGSNSRGGSGGRAGRGVSNQKTGEKEGRSAGAAGGERGGRTGSSTGKGKAVTGGRGGAMAGRGGEKAAGRGAAAKAATMHASRHSAGAGQGAVTSVASSSESKFVHGVTNSDQGVGSNRSSEGHAVDSEGAHATSAAQQAPSSRPTSAASASRTLLWSASARRPPSATHDTQFSPAASVSSHSPNASRPGSVHMRPGSGNIVGGRPGSANRVRPNSANAEGAEESRPGSASRVQPVSAEAKTEGTPGSVLGAGGLGRGGGGSTSNTAQDPEASLTQPTWLREEVEHKKAAAAARLAQQRAQQAALSGAIRALRQDTGGESQGQTVAELRSNLTLRAAVEAGPGAADAVCAALASVRSSQDHLAVGSTGGLVSSALRDHASGLAATPYGARAAAVASQDNSLRNSMARLERLTASTKAALALRQQQMTGGGLEEDAEQGDNAESDEGSSAEMSDEGVSVGPGTGRTEGSSAPGSKYLNLIKARAQAREAIAAESEHEQEGN